MVCAAPDCEKAPAKRGLCPMHYSRLRRHGSLDRPPSRDCRPLAVRWPDHVTASPSGCWGWDGRAVVDGYHCAKDRGRSVLVHRFIYEAVVGPIPDGLQLDHLCRNRACVNPEHLEPATQQENIRRGDQGKRNAAKTRCPQGHPYDRVNTYVTPGDSARRQCRKCKRELKLRRREQSEAGVRSP